MDTSERIKFSPKSDEEYRVTQAYLSKPEKSEGVAWFSYSFPSERNLNVTIRGFPADTAIEEVLRTMGYEPDFLCALYKHERAGQDALCSPNCGVPLI
ncbi:hypothetical protein JYU34_018293 [Plutella xylostella]|uniref:Uncharacterized protein n=1 Tax=Plutella xylostella TaxID=51655 RepID=A0ABQ7Q0F2_PLUXY|nr:hypothetical protein JYU34_018293 [Plutella xylostella]